MTEPEAGPGKDSGWSDLGALQMQPRSEREPVKFRPGIWVGLYVLFCSLATLWLVSSRQDSALAASNLGYLVGAFLAVWIWSYPIGWAAFRMGGRSLVSGRIVVCVVATLLMIGQLGQKLDSFRNDRTEQAAFAKDLRSDLNTMMEGSKSDGPMKALDSRTTMSGRSGEMQAFVKSYLNKVISQHNQYLAELEAVGWMTVLDPERIEKDVGMVEGQAVVARSRATVEKFRQLWIGTLRDTVEAASAMEREDPSKRGFAAGFRDSVVKAEAQANAIWDIEAQIVDTGGEVIGMLAEHRKDWEVQSGQFVFSDDRTLSIFNAEVAKFDELVRREEALQAANRAQAERNIRALETP